MAWSGSRKQFIEKYGAFVHKATRGTGILPGTLITQLFIESQSENKPGVVGSSGLTQRSNNYFGIKCAGGWKGATVYADTREVINGKNVIVNACFRKYNSIEDSIKDYINFLQSNARYKNAGVFEAKTVKSQAEALKRAGYATATNYAAFINDIYTPYALLIDQQKSALAFIDWKKLLGVGLLAAAFTQFEKILRK
jgi:flagellum-specific peptidoglycan hydrolase FlgJ